MTGSRARGGMRPSAVRVALAACLAWVLVCVCGLAAAAPPVADTMAQRVLACTACHGLQGRASAVGYVPRIAGKPMGYLFQQLLAFRDGSRRHDGMARLLEHLDDRYLAELASHFAAQDLPYPPPGATGQQVDGKVLARGEMLVRQGDPSRQLPACSACHGASLTGVSPFVPGLLGLPRDYVISQLGSWRLGARQARKPDCMAQIAQRLQAADVAAVAEWLQAQPVPVPSAAAAQAQAAWPMDCGSFR